jgi:hypothetical protein
MIEPIDLVALVDAHLSQTGEAPTAFGRRVANDPQLVRDLRQNRSVGTILANKIIAAINKVDESATGTIP